MSLNVRRFVSWALRQKRAAYSELLQRAERHEKVARAAARMSYEKTAMGKGRKRKLRESELQEGSTTETVYKWKQERKK